MDYYVSVRVSAHRDGLGSFSMISFFECLWEEQRLALKILLRSACLRRNHL